MKLCSACLLGLNCKYNGKNRSNDKVLELSKKEILIPICPEQLGGGSTPRPACEILGGDGHDVLHGNAKVIDCDGNDFTKLFINGAKETLKIARLLNIKEAILTQRSPSCGNGKTYDGTFTDSYIDGDGVAAAFLKENGIAILSEDEI